MNKLWIDTETYSPVPIARGTYRYATQVELMVATYAMNGEETLTHDFTADPTPPRELLQRIKHCDTINAHNAQFDRIVLNRQPWFQALDVTIERWRCMMARAYRHGLPGKLEKLSEIFQLGNDGKIDGRLFIELFCKPTKAGERFTAKTHPLEWEAFLVYAAQDIVALRALDTKMPNWNESKFEHWQWAHDQRRNDRGFPVDLALCEAIVETTTAEAKRLANRTEELTAGEVLKATQRDKLLKWLLGEYGVDLPDLRADTIQRRLDDPELPESLKELLRIRLASSKSSSTKAKRVLEGHVNGRIHGGVQYGGALRTLRDAGRIVQPQNLPRPKHKAWEIEQGIEAMKGGYIHLLTDDIMGLASSALRGMIHASPGHKLIAADLANIEGRYAAWTAGEEWKLKAFRDYDTIIGMESDGKGGQRPVRKGPDLYKLSYARAFSVSPATVGDESTERQIGKVMELSLQYYGGVGAFAAMAGTYGIDLDDLADRAWHTIPSEVLASSRQRWFKECEKLKDNATPFEMNEKTYVVCLSLVTLWRRAHPNIVQFWYALDAAMRGAIETPNQAFPVRGIVVDRQGAWLRIRLQSGRYLCYPSPRISDNGTISYAGVNAYSRQWCRIKTYSGKAFENIVQAGARDVFKVGEGRIELAGFPVVLPVHDEAVCEVPDAPEYTLEAVTALLTQGDRWTAGLPLAAAGRVMYRYGKG
jgi:DNA polymerase